MSESLPFVQSVFHPSDFTQSSHHAFAHALAMALRRRTELTMLHVARDDESVELWTGFPAVRGTLERWGLLEPGSPRSAVFDRLGVRVKKINLRGRNPLTAIIGYLDENPTDMIVLSSEGRDGLPRWLDRSTAEGLARKTKTMTLFVPRDIAGFVSVDNGEVTLKRILLPIDRKPNPETAMVYATRAATLAGGGEVEVLLTHIGEQMPAVELPQASCCRFETVLRTGGIVEQITALAKERAVDLMIMPTEGRTGILDVLRGSVTEQVLRQAPCPVLAVPMDD